ncbi:MAG: histidine phosphatase family protein [Bdellovibrionia bacterium]
MKLLVVRHAKAEERDNFSRKSSDDDLRPLTDEGRQVMAESARRIRKWAGVPDILVSSKLVRAVQTAEILAKEFGSSGFLQIGQLAPDESPMEFLKWLETCVAEKSPRMVCCVGHEPHLSLMVSYFLTGEARSFIDFKKSGACLIEFSDGQIEERAATLRWHIGPKT